jgi:hypothetical protein
MSTSFRISLLTLTLLGAGLALAAEKSSAPTPSQVHLDYLPDGRAVPPKNYRDWPFLTSGLNMNYSDPGTPADHSMFDNVFVDPQSMLAFKATGKWPEGAVLVKEGRMGLTKGSINKAGQFQAESVMMLEVHVKDQARFAGGWAFFAFGSEEPVAQIPTAAGCYSCHQTHAAVDTTFVQFYPTLIDIARTKQTLSAGYKEAQKKEQANPSASSH